MVFMEKANVVLIEDGHDHRELVQRHIDVSDHEITREATTFEEGMAVIDEIANGEVPCDVVILDGNLDPSLPKDYRHARALLGKMRELQLNVKIIGFASYKLSKFDIDVDADLDKTEAAQLIPTIDNL
jgi:hypothetical protein